VVFKVKEYFYLQIICLITGIAGYPFCIVILLGSRENSV